MTLSRQEVEKIAHLARLGLTADEITLFSQQLSTILEYVEKLAEVDTTGVEPTAQVTGLENVMRQDVIDACDAATRRALLDQAPSTKDGLIKTKSVF